MARKDQGNGAEQHEAGEDKTPTAEAESKEKETPEQTETTDKPKEEQAEESGSQETKPAKGLLVDSDPKAKATKQKMFRIIIDEQDNNDKNGPVKCTDGQNKQYTIWRGHEVDVPEGVVNVIKESVYEVYEEKGDETITRQIPRYAMRIIKEL